MKPKLVLINGPLGAGKTTFLKQLLTLDEFKEARVIENEFASSSVDSQALHDHLETVETIAGICICCSTGDELADALQSLSVSPKPVIIEATGVANSLKLIEKIVVSDMLERYDLAHAVFILDASEAATNIEATVDTYFHELKAADTVLLSKRDLISAEQLETLETELDSIGCKQVAYVDEGVFNEKLLQTPSQILYYFAELDEEIENHDGEANFTIVDVSDTPLEAEALQTIWDTLKTTHGLQRMKGSFVTPSGETLHVEATPSQCRVTPETVSQPVHEIVLIGNDARSITKATFLQAAGK